MKTIPPSEHAQLLPIACMPHRFVLMAHCHCFGRIAIPTTCALHIIIRWNCGKISCGLNFAWAAHITLLLQPQQHWHNTKTPKLDGYVGAHLDRNLYHDLVCHCHPISRLHARSPAIHRLSNYSPLLGTRVPPSDHSNIAVIEAWVEYAERTQLGGDCDYSSLLCQSILEVPGTSYPVRDIVISGSHATKKNT